MDAIVTIERAARHTLLALALVLATGSGAQPPSGPPGGPGDGAHAPPDVHPHGRPFISPMGEPFRGGGDVAPEEAWFVGVDRNGDGRLTLAEFTADAARFFNLLDVDHDGEIGPEEIERYEQVIAPETRTGGGYAGRTGEGGGRGAGGGHRGGRGGGGGGGGGGRGGGGGFGGGGGGGGHGGGGGFGGGGDGGGQSPGGDHAPAAADAAPQGAARFGYLGLPEPVIAADADLNRGVSRGEFARAAAARFVLLDANHDGVITRDELPALHGGGGGRHAPGGRPPRPAPTAGQPG